MGIIMINREKFLEAKEKIIGINRERNGIGTLKEKTVHAVLKYYYEFDEDKQEIPIENFVADIFTGNEIIEIQTAHFNKLRDKLSCFLEQYNVTVVYPIPRKKYLIWVDEETGEYTPRRKSPATGSPYVIFPELYKIKNHLRNRNLNFKIVMLDLEEFRLLNGYARNRKKGSTRYDRIPLDIVDELVIERQEDYIQFIPYELEEEFTSKEFAKEAKINISLSQTTLNILDYVGAVERIGKRGRSYLYKVKG